MIQTLVRVIRFVGVCCAVSLNSLALFRREAHTHFHRRCCARKERSGALSCASPAIRELTYILLSLEKSLCSRLCEFVGVGKEIEGEIEGRERCGAFTDLS